MSAMVKLQVRREGAVVEGQVLQQDDGENVSNVNPEANNLKNPNVQSENESPVLSLTALLAAADAHPRIRPLRPPIRGSKIIGKVPKGVKVIHPQKDAPLHRRGMLESGSSDYERFEMSLRSDPGIKPTLTTRQSPLKFKPNAHETAEDLPLPSQDVEEVSIDDSKPPTTRAELLHVLATTDTVDDAWGAYQTLRTLPSLGTRLLIPWEHLHRLARLISSVKPRTQTSFIRLLAAISMINVTGGHVELWEWNALIDFAGKGWRKTKPEDYKTALGVFNDLASQRSPGATFSQNQQDFRGRSEEALQRVDTPTPDIITYTTLLNIGARTKHHPTFRHASMILHTSGITPNRITLLATLTYHSRMRDLANVRTTIGQINDSGFELGLDGTNACLWAYARNGRFEVASAIYFVLKHQLEGGDENEADFQNITQYLQTTEGIEVPREIVPNHITYVSLLQAYAFHGDLFRSLQVFMDMVSDLSPKDAGSGYLPDHRYMLPAYRAIFLGFLRHAKTPRQLENDRFLSHRLQHRQSLSSDPAIWSLAAIQALFDDFLGVSSEARPSERTLYWILVAFAKLTGDDTEKLKEVYSQLEGRFGGDWGGRLARLKRNLYRETRGHLC